MAFKAAPGHCRKNGFTLEGEMKAVSPIGLGMTGAKYKAVFSNVPDPMLDDSIIPGLEEQNCRVQRLRQDLQAQDRKRSMASLQKIQSRVDSIGDVTKLTATIDRLSAMHGDGGPEEKRHRFARGAMVVLQTSVAVGSARLDEAQPKD